MAKLSAKAKAAKARKYLVARDKGKHFYAEANGRLQDLINDVKVGERIDLGGGQVFEIVDNFADTNTVWKPAGVNRFDAKVTNV